MFNNTLFLLGKKLKSSSEVNIALCWANCVMQIQVWELAVDD